MESSQCNTLIYVQVQIARSQLSTNQHPTDHLKDS